MCILFVRQLVQTGKSNSIFRIYLSITFTKHYKTRKRANRKICILTTATIAQSIISLLHLKRPISSALHSTSHS